MRHAAPAAATSVHTPHCCRSPWLALKALPAGHTATSAWSVNNNNNPVNSTGGIEAKAVSAGVYTFYQVPYPKLWVFVGVSQAVQSLLMSVGLVLSHPLSSCNQECSTRVEPLNF